MRSTSLRRARSWTVAALAASAVATAILGFHLAADHAAALAEGTSNLSGTSNVTPAQHSDDDGFTLFDDHDDHDDDGDEGSGVFGPGNQGTQSQNGFTSPGQLGAGSGQPQVTSHGS